MGSFRVHFTRAGRGQVTVWVLKSVAHMKASLVRDNKRRGMREQPPTHERPGTSIVSVMQGHALFSFILF